MAERSQIRARSVFASIITIGITFLLTISVMRPSPIKSDETVVFLSGFGSKATNGWLLHFHGWVYESKIHRPITALFRRAIGIRDDELSAPEKATFRERAQFFLVDNERRKSVLIHLGDMTFKLDPSLANGHFHTNLLIRTEDIDRFGLSTLLTNLFLPFQMVPPKTTIQAVSGAIQLLPPSGLSIISDIDDTIKITDVRDRKELLRNTFCRPYQPVEGMAPLYAQWEKTSGARFHYVSASPWQLYLPLCEFIQTNQFPSGTYHLKLFRWKDRTALDLFKSPEKYKLSTITPFLKEFPERKFVLVGYSGEKDPETYGVLAREFPSQIIRIFIRDVTGEPRSSLRYERAFWRLSTNVWTIFKDPAELPRILP